MMDSDFQTTTREFLKDLRTFQWFSAVGEELPADINAIQVSSWEEAWQAHSDESWIASDFHKADAQQFPIFYHTYEFVKEDIKERDMDHQFHSGTRVSSSAAWDAGIAAYEIEYDIPERLYFEKFIPWYKKGHWPCAWSGKYPEGCLIIF